MRSCLSIVYIITDIPGCVSMTSSDLIESVKEKILPRQARQYARQQKQLRGSAYPYQCSLFTSIPKYQDVET